MQGMLCCKRTMCSGSDCQNLRNPSSRSSAHSQAFPAFFLQERRSHGPNFSRVRGFLNSTCQRFGGETSRLSMHQMHPKPHVMLIGYTYNCAANCRLILATCSLLQSMSSSAWSPLCFLLLGLMGGGPVL